MLAVVPSPAVRHKKHIPTQDASFRTPSIERFEQHSNIAKFQAVLESQGGRWEGSVEAISLTGATLIIAGYPVMIQSQSLNLEIVTNGISVELMGIVGRIRQKTGGNLTIGCGVSIDIDFKNHDDLVKHRLQMILRQLRATSQSGFLHATIIPQDHGNGLWEMRATSDSSEFLPDLVSTDQVTTHTSCAYHLPPNRSMRAKDPTQTSYADQGRNVSHAFAKYSHRII